MEELFHRTLFALNELDIVNEQNVDLAVAPLEFLNAFFTHRVDEVVGEFLRVHVAHTHLREK